MALTRKMLKGMGLTEEQVDTIIEAHTDTVNALKDERDQYKDSAEKLPGVQKELEELKKKNGEGFEQKYNDLLKEYEDYKKDQLDKANRAAVSDAYREMLKEAGVSEKRIPAVMRVADLSAVKLDKEGKLKDKDKLVESVKEEWSDFIQTKGTQGAKTTTPPGNNGGTMTKDDILKIKDAGERQQKIAENHELFGF